MKTYKSSELSTNKRGEILEEARKNGVLINECRTNGVINEFELKIVNEDSKCKWRSQIKKQTETIIKQSELIDSLL